MGKNKTTNHSIIHYHNSHINMLFPKHSQTPSSSNRRDKFKFIKTKIRAKKRLNFRKRGGVKFRDEDNIRLMGIYINPATVPNEGNH